MTTEYIKDSVKGITSSEEQIPIILLNKKRIIKNTLRMK